MNPDNEKLQGSIAKQREALSAILQEPLRELAQRCGGMLGDRNRLNAVLGEALQTLPDCKFLMDTVLSVVGELMQDHGLYHVILHFSSSRAVIWLFDDPYRYRLLDIEALIDPDICLAYPHKAYPHDALVPAGRIRAVLDQFRELRFMDEMLYLRSGTLNIFNGVVGLTFSCDGSHYIPYDEFLTLDRNFWSGG